ncbi:siderophore ABC transporter substrate-binding protein [Paraliobacillus sediminis]|uniref:siderophore ABC transporter substrate-binding protein n=1 Tax=Paraliobacillus sediminis TaxID=1885916 RepID=UPI000E3B96E0|nr:siderophore ABC transporter substrate-binding protein [Paraliobacillus sediminis]
MKKLALLLLMLLFAIVAVACGSESDEAAATDDIEEEQTDEEVEEVEAPTEIEVEHELGTTTVPVNPEKVVVFDFGTLDSLDKLGVDVAAVAQENLPSYLSSYEDSAYENAGTLFEPDFEKLAEIDPDLIIISGRTAEAYDDLTELAPTIHMGVDTTRYMESFEENVTLLGEIFTKQEEASTALEEIETTIADLKESIPTDKTGLIVLTNDGSLSAYGPGSRFGLIHDVFGITPADEEIESSTHGQNVSFEYVSETNPDYIFAVDRNKVTGGDYTAESSLDNELVNGTNAAQEDHIVLLSPDYWYLSGGGLISVAEMVNEIAAGVE